MAVIKINQNPSAGEMRWFGLIMLLFFALLGTVVCWRVGWELTTAPMVIWSIGVVLCFVYYAVRAFRRAMYLGWMYAVFPIGWVVSHVVLAVTYYLVLTPIGLIMRLIGRDPMERTLDPEAKTYWIDHELVTDASRYFRQY